MTREAFDTQAASFGITETTDGAGEAAFVRETSVQGEAGTWLYAFGNGSAIGVDIQGPDDQRLSWKQPRQSWRRCWPPRTDRVRRACLADPVRQVRAHHRDVRGGHHSGRQRLLLSEGRCRGGCGGDVAGRARDSAAGPITGPILEIGIIFGLLTAVLGGLNLLAPWLLITYALIAVGVAIVFRFGAPAYTSILEAADAGDDARVASLLADSPYRRAALANAGMFAAVIFLMVVAVRLTRRSADCNRRNERRP